jgi:UDP:flavonoid glycosyltransferase YjiC (YdhE family)
MIVLPLFWDQYDNAQRVEELGFGVRLDTYRFEDKQLQGSIDALLTYKELRSRMDVNGQKIRSRDGKVVAADLIEEVGRRARSG